MSSPLPAPSPWNTDLPLPCIGGDAGMTQVQVALGGLSLLLSRLNPAFAHGNFLATQRVVQRLRRAVEYRNPAKALLVAAELQEVLREAERALDPGTVLALKALLAQTLKQENDSSHDRSDGFSLSDFMAEQQLTPN